MPISVFTRDLYSDQYGTSRGLLRPIQIACRSHAAPMPFPCHAMPLRVYNVSFPFDNLHSAAVSDSHLPCHAPTMPFFSRPQHSTAVERGPRCAVALRRMAWSEHDMDMACKCESDTAALCKSNGKDAF